MPASRRWSLPTIAAIAIAAYVLSNIVHEGLGHGGVCLAVGGRPVAISTAWFRCNEDDVGRNAARAVSAGGTIANLVVGVVMLALVRRSSGSPARRYFCWLLMMVSLLQAGGYLLVSPLAGFGDWASFVRGYAPGVAWPLKLGLTAIGLAISLFALQVGRRGLEPFVVSDGIMRKNAAKLLCWVSYFSAAVPFAIAALRDPERSIALSGLLAAHFGGTAWLAWVLPFTMKDTPGAPARGPTIVDRSTGWLFAGGVAAVVCVLVLGPSVAFR